MDRQGLKQSSALGGWLLAATAVAVAVGAILVWGFFSGRNEAAVDVEREQQVKAPLRVSTKNGETLITLDAETRQRNGNADPDAVSRASPGVRDGSRHCAPYCAQQQLRECQGAGPDRAGEAWNVKTSARTRAETLRVSASNLTGPKGV